MRKLIHQQLLQVAQGLPYLLDGEGAPKIYTPTALGVDDIPPAPVKPFAVIREQPSTVHQAVQETSNANTRVFQVYVYDNTGSYVRIDEVLAAFRDRIKLLPGLQSPSGAFCIGSRWDGMSQDMFAEEYAAAMRFATFRLTTNQ